MAEYRHLNKGYYFQVCGKKKCSNRAAVFKRYSTNSSNADSGYLFPSIRLLQALESLHAPTVLTAPSLLALQGEPYPVSRDASAPHSLLAAWQHCCKRPVSRLIHIVSSEKSDICGLVSHVSAGIGSPVRKLKQKSPDIVLCVSTAARSSCRGFLMLLMFQTITIQCTLHWTPLRSAHGSSILPSYEKSPPEIHALCAESPTCAKHSCCVAWTFLLVALLPCKQESRQGMKKKVCPLAWSSGLVGWIFRVQLDFGLLHSHLQVTFSQFVPQLFTHPMNNLWVYTLILVTATVC